MVIEGGPLDGLQCGEKMWIIFDSNSAPYFDSQFLVVGKYLIYSKKGLGNKS
jgi:hypothetical protein